MSYSEFLRQTRKAAKLTQGQLAEAVSARGHKTALTTVSNYENAYYKKQDGSETTPNRQFVILAAQICEADVNEALRLAGLSPEPMTRKEMLLQVLRDSHRIDLGGGLDSLETMDDAQFEDLVREIRTFVRVRTEDSQ